MDEPIPAVVCVDVEPDPREVDRGSAEPWVGFEKLVLSVGGVRETIEEVTGRPVHLTWFLRMDPQVAETWETPRGGRPCAAYRQGDRAMTTRLARLVDDAGVVVDLTVEPGLAGTFGLVPGELSTGWISPGSERRSSSCERSAPPRPGGPTTASSPSSAPTLRRIIPRR